MKYVSTRGDAPALGFSDVLLAGLARDGGLYVPEAWPQFEPEEIRGFAGCDHHAAAFAILRPFVGGEIDDADFARICHEAYATFTHPAVTPLRQLAPDKWVLELFHGPTLAFKDVAMQIVARLMDHVLGKRRTRVTVIVATSGDTGGAAVEAFRGRDNVDLFVFFPEGRVSPLQQVQMTTSGAANVHAVAVKGTFDDCQSIVKGLFNNHALRDRLSLAGVNSINWVRLAAQIVYYFTAAANLGAPERKVAFVVPTGNFGDVFAGYAAKRMGLPVAHLFVATNVNDILARTLATGRYELRAVTPTSSPSMDIQISSNFERLLFEAHGRDPAAVKKLMGDLRSGAFGIAKGPLGAIREDFTAKSTDEAETARVIAETWRETGFLPDPHTAVGLAVARRFSGPGVAYVTLATAHPAKFPDAVEKATGHKVEIPESLAKLTRRKESYSTVANDLAEVEEFVLARARAVRERA